MGPPLHPSVYGVLGWVSLPAAFLVAMGEPFSLLAIPWERVILIRMPHRLGYWTGKIAAWLLAGWLYCLLAFALAAVVALGLSPSSISKNLPPYLIVGDRFISGPGLPVLAWVFVGVLVTNWWFMISLFFLSLALKQPGMATVWTILLNTFLVALAGTSPFAARLLGPVAGPVLLAQALGPELAPSSFLAAGCLACSWLVAAGVAGYLVFRRRLF
ncbi:hypothetical protein ACTLLP_04585 [Desulfothermobacter acidiphilus]